MVRNTSTQSNKHEGPSHIVILFSVVHSLNRGTLGDLTPDLETPAIARAVYDALSAAGRTLPRRGIHTSHTAVVTHGISTVEDIRNTLEQYDPSETLVFNLCEALNDDASTGEVRAAVQIASRAFCSTGADPQALERCLDKGGAHDVLQRSGVPTAEWQVFCRVPSASESIQVPYPAIVKPAREDCSLAITEASVVDTDDALRQQVNRINIEYGQPALVERFLSGREFSVSVWGYENPGIVGIGQIDFGDCEDPRRRIETYENKWTDRFRGVYPASVSRAEARRLSQLGRAAYRALGCSGYARVDVREDAGAFYVLEVNPNPSLAPDAGFPRAAAATGIDYATMAARIAESAWCHRRQMRSRLADGKSHMEAGSEQPELQL